MTWSIFTWPSSLPTQPSTGTSLAETPSPMHHSALCPYFSLDSLTLAFQREPSRAPGWEPTLQAGDLAED